MKPDCPSTMTFGSGYPALDEELARRYGIGDIAALPWPVHHCEHKAGHDLPHKDGDITWTATTITFPIRVTPGE